MIDGYYGRWADLNGDGEVDDFEKLVEMDEMERMDKFISGDDEEDEDEELWDELAYMDEDERREAMEDAGLDTDDYEF